MNELKWVLLAEVYGRAEAELIESLLEANEIEAELVQEAYEHLAYPNTMSRVQIFVPADLLGEAKKLYAESGWEFEVPDDDEDDGKNSE